MTNVFTQKDPLLDAINGVVLGEKKLTDAELKKREEIAQAIERENPEMDMGKKMAIATAQAKKVAEEIKEAPMSAADKLKKRLNKLDPSREARQKQISDLAKKYSPEKKESEKPMNEAEDTQQLMLLRAMAQDPSDLMKMKRALKAGDKALTNPILRQEILKMLDQMMNLTITDKSLLQRTRMGFQKKKMKMPEEVQIGEAIGAKDKQDEGEYGYEGDMAMSQLRTIMRSCKEMTEILEKNTDMPEWVQSKLTLATDYIQTARDYLMSELEEQLESETPCKSAAVRIKEIAKTPLNKQKPDKK